MANWSPYPYDSGAYRYDPAALKARWDRLHAGDAEPLPDDPDVLQAWALFHAGDFEQACQAGLKAGPGGLVVAHKAQSVYAQYLEPSEQHKLALFQAVAARAEAQLAYEPDNANVHYLFAFALGRCSPGLRQQQALAQDLGARVKGSLETAIRLQPRHADAHVALGSFHAEVIDKVGKMLGHTQGADAATGLRLFRQALKLNPTSAMAMIEYANGLLMLEGEHRLAEAEELYAQAAACEPMDATERLDVEKARAELED